MKEFNNIEEIEQYFNKKLYTYIFKNSDGLYIDVKFNFDLNIGTRNIDARNINAWNIDAGNINAWNINAWNIDAGNINARNINAWNIDAGNINAGDIDARNINAGNIDAGNINAEDISFYAVCTSYNNIECTKCEGRREHAIINTLDGDIHYKKGEEK